MNDESQAASGDNQDDASEESAVATLAVETEMLAPYSEERAQAKESIRLAFISGRATLAASAIKHRIPYETVLGWSKREEWALERDKTGSAISRIVTETMQDFVAEQKQVQIRRALVRAQKLRELVDSAAENEKGTDVGLLASAVQALASAEERADNIVRRNLGMDGQSNGGGSQVSVNIVASGGVQFS